MRLFRRRTAIAAALLVTLSLPAIATATPDASLKDNDETHLSVSYATPSHTATSCAGMSANIYAQQSEGEAPNILATIGVHSDNGRKAYRLFDVAQDSLPPEHSNAGILVGCLTENGGIGIYVPHQDGHDHALSIQIDRQGRIFLGYDQIGMMLRAIKPN